jgi:hypothetical protein
MAEYESATVNDVRFSHLYYGPPEGLVPAQRDVALSMMLFFFNAKRVNRITTGTNSPDSLRLLCDNFKFQILLVSQTAILTQ